MCSLKSKARARAHTHTHTLTHTHTYTQTHTKLQSLIPYFLTAWSRVLLEKLTSSQLAKKFLVLYGTRRFITTFTSARQMSLSWKGLIQSMPPHRTSWRLISILSSCQSLGSLMVSFPQVSPGTNTTINISNQTFAHTAIQRHSMWKCLGFILSVNIHHSAES